MAEERIRKRIKDNERSANRHKVGMEMALRRNETSYMVAVRSAKIDIDKGNKSDAVNTLRKAYKIDKAVKMYTQKLSDLETVAFETLDDDNEIVMNKMHSNTELKHELNAIENGGLDISASRLRNSRNRSRREIEKRTTNIMIKSDQELMKQQLLMLCDDNEDESGGGGESNKIDNFISDILNSFGAPAVAKKKTILDAPVVPDSDIGDLEEEAEEDDDDIKEFNSRLEKMKNEPKSNFLKRIPTE